MPISTSDQLSVDEALNAEPADFKLWKKSIRKKSLQNLKRNVPGHLLSTSWRQTIDLIFIFFLKSDGRKEQG